jgi:hypothetical protein
MAHPIPGGRHTIALHPVVEGASSRGGLAVGFGESE